MSDCKPALVICLCPDLKLMVMTPGYMKLTKLVVPLFYLLLTHCNSSIPPEYGMVDWSLRNASGNSLSLVVYDKICKRTYFRVRLTRSGQIGMSTCANIEGTAEIRYRRTGYDKGDNPWSDASMNPNQSFLIRFWLVATSKLEKYCIGDQHITIKSTSKHDELLLFEAVVSALGRKRTLAELNCSDTGN